MSLLIPYIAPKWASGLKLIPKYKVNLGCFPTPIQTSKKLNNNKIEIQVKREDLCDILMSSNKVRKLEFLLADAIANDFDSIVTIGGIQSNHTRTCCVAARQLGLEPFVVLRTDEKYEEIGDVGNLFGTKLMDSTIFRVTKNEYKQFGQMKLLEMAAEKIRKQHKKPYLIPAGGSTPLGAWGYIDFVRELEEQQQSSSKYNKIKHIFLPIGSGGTAAGIAIGIHLAKLPIKVHAYAVCDNEKYFYDHIQHDIDALFDSSEKTPPPSSRDLLRITDQFKGVGYAMSTEEELKLIGEVSKTSGLLLDPVYTSKAINGFLKEFEKNQFGFGDDASQILFIHTGGSFSNFAYTTQMQKAGILSQPSSIHNLIHENK